MHRRRHAAVSFADLVERWLDKRRVNEWLDQRVDQWFDERVDQRYQWWNE